MPSRALKLLAVLCACLGLSAGLAACGGDDEKSSTISLTELPGDPSGGPASSGGSSGGGDAAGGDDAAGGSDAADDGAAGGEAVGGDDAPANDDAAAGDDAAGDDTGGDSAGGADSGGGDAASAEGKAIFTQSCAGCHTLADAGASGSVGPNLDDARPDEAAVAAKVRAGGGGMPSFDGTLAPEQIQAVAAYVSGAAGS